MRITKLATFAMTLPMVVALSVAAADADKHSGTWKMNPAKSKYNPGPTPKNITLKVEMDENKMKIESEGTAADGTPTHVAYDAKFDGKDYALTGVPNADKVWVKRIGSNTIESIVKKGDQVVMTVRSTVSKDGKTRTSTFKGKDAQGKAVNNVVVYDKQ